MPGGQSYIESLLGQATALFIWAPPGSASLGPLPTLRPAATPPALLPTPPPFPPVFLSLPRWLGDKKILPTNAGGTVDEVASLGWKDTLEEEMATHSRILD